MNDFQRVLDSTERHLLSLKSSGVRYVPVQAETLRQLSGPPPVVAPVPEKKPAPQVSISTNGHAESLPAAPVTLPVQPTAVPAPVIDKESAMADLRQRALACLKCPHLVSSRKNVVFGVGSVHAELMFVGEAPGADEDVQGEPFVGAAGQLLTRIIKTMGLSRETVYIANILKCRPDTPGQAYGNRKPTAEEMQTCLPYLLSQIEIIRPKVMVALGATAIEGLLGNVGGITKVRGKFQTFRNIPLMPTFHPAYLLRNQALTEKRKVWEDMLQVMQKLQMPISEKQQGYFLK